MRIQITASIDIEELEPGEIDLDSHTGLSEDAYLKYVVGETGEAWRLSDLDDVDCKLVSA